MTENPNPYDDDEYARGVVELSTAIQRLWDGGASVENIEDEMTNAMENAADGTRFDVTIGARP